MSEKSLYQAGKLLIGMVTSPDKTASVATKQDSIATESRECITLAKIGLTGKVMERLHQSTIGFCVSNQDSPKTIGCRVVAIRWNVSTSWWAPT